MTYTTAQMEAACEALADVDATTDEVAFLAQDLPGEYAHHLAETAKAEARWFAERDAQDARNRAAMKAQVAA